MNANSKLIRRKKYCLTISEIFFEDNYELSSKDACDILLLTQCSLKTKNSTVYNTLQIDLDKNEEILLSELRKNTRTEISRCERRDELNAQIINQPSLEQLNQFINFYNKFSKTKNLPYANIGKLMALVKIGALSIGVIKNSNGETLVSHAHIVLKKRARLLYSASLYREFDDNQVRNLIGRANRALHWNEIIFFKNKSFKLYDFGGLSLSNDKKLSQIDDFKKGFGGKHVEEYNAKIGVSIFGKLAIFFYGLMQ